MSLDKHFFLAFLFVILEQSSAALGSPPTPNPFPPLPRFDALLRFLGGVGVAVGARLGTGLVVGAGLVGEREVVGEGEVEGGSCKEKKNEWSVRLTTEHEG